MDIPGRQHWSAYCQHSIRCEDSRVRPGWCVTRLLVGRTTTARSGWRQDHLLIKAAIQRELNVPPDFWEGWGIQAFFRDGLNYRDEMINSVKELVLNLNSVNNNLQEFKQTEDYQLGSRIYLFVNFQCAFLSEVLKLSLMFWVLNTTWVSLGNCLQVLNWVARTSCINWPSQVPLLLWGMNGKTYSSKREWGSRPLLGLTEACTE